MTPGGPDSGFAARCEAALARAGVPGAALGVAVRGEAWTRGFGTLRAGGSRPVTPETTFRVASLTKPCTALLALALARDGVLALEEEVAGAPVGGITVRHLLAHLGGFESERGDLARFGEGDDALERLCAELGDQRQVVAPGTLWSYSNAGYWLLGRLLAERAGAGYEAALAERVLRPLGLLRTGFGRPEATGHEDGEPLADAYPRARNPSGGLVSNVPDLLALAEHLASPGAAPLRARLARTPDGWYGLGLALDEAGGLELWGHDGGYEGFESRLRLEPARGFSFVGLASAAGGGRALDAILDDALELRLGVRRPQLPTVPATRDELAAVAGRYAQPELELEVRPREAGVAVAPVRIHRVSGERTPEPEAAARPVGRRLFEVTEGERAGDRFDFHPEAGSPRFVRFASRLAERVWCY